MIAAGFLAKVGSLLTGSNGGLIEKVGGIIDNLNLSGEEKAEIKAQIVAEANRSQEAMMALLNAESAIEVDDRKDARLRVTELAKAGQRDWVMDAVSVIVVLLVGFVVVFTCVHTKLDPMVSSTLNTLTGLLFGLVTQMFSFWYGSTLGNLRRANNTQSAQVSQTTTN
jgi:hypothetical protein